MSVLVKTHRFGLILLVAAMAGESTAQTTAPSEPVTQVPDTDGGEFHNVHNVIQISPQLFSGSVPEGEASFAELQKRGIRTVLSVDGATPDVENAHKYGMRYVHLPVGYHGIDLPRQLQIARAVRDLPGPVYVHCHHGKHRGPTAAASAAVALSLLTPDDAIAFMKKAGTAEGYAGLYDCIRHLTPVPPSELDRVAADFPEVAPVPAFVKAMSDLQETYDHLVEIRNAGWRTPWDHPDLVPAAEIGMMENLLRGLQEDPERQKHPADFAEMLQTSWKSSQDLEDALKQNKPEQGLSATLERINDSCKACHRVYRNTR